jgi:hypothetical protein
MSTKNPGVTAAALFSLSLGIAATTTIFQRYLRSAAGDSPVQKIPRASWFYGNRTRAKDCRRLLLPPPTFETGWRTVVLSKI